MCLENCPLEINAINRIITMDNLDKNSIPLSVSAEKLVSLLRSKAGSGNNINDDRSYTETGLLSTTLSEDAETRDAIAAWISAQQEHNQSVENILYVLNDAMTIERSRVSRLFKHQTLLNVAFLLLLSLITGRVFLIDSITNRPWNVFGRMYHSKVQSNQRSPVFIQSNRDI